MSKTRQKKRCDIEDTAYVIFTILLFLFVISAFIYIVILI